jgi:hypothetical protein
MEPHREPRGDEGQGVPRHVSGDGKVIAGYGTHPSGVVQGFRPRLP